MAMDSARGLAAWAVDAGARLTIEDCGDHPDNAAQVAREISGDVDVFFGPYGSGAMRAVATALAGAEVIIWNHGGAAVPQRGSRVVDVLAPAERYWSGLGDVLRADEVELDRVAILHAASGFGRDVAEGAVVSLARAGVRPLSTGTFDEHTAVQVASDARASGAAAVIGCGRFEDDVALGHALRGTGIAVGLVACGVAGAVDALGHDVIGRFGPSQWLAQDAGTPTVLEAGLDYPAAQAYAAGQVAQQAVAAAGSTSPAAVWDAVRALRTTTLLGDFALDEHGRQVGLTPLIVKWHDGPAGPVRRVAWRDG
jgi:branched-chain amino acid transport system substrate-binding protein